MKRQRIVKSIDGRINRDTNQPRSSSEVPNILLLKNAEIFVLSRILHSNIILSTQASAKVEKPPTI